MAHKAKRPTLRLARRNPHQHKEVAILTQSSFWLVDSVLLS